MSSEKEFSKTYESYNFISEYRFKKDSGSLVFCKPSTFSVVLLSASYSSLSKIKLDNLSVISFSSSTDGVSSNLT